MLRSSAIGALAVVALLAVAASGASAATKAPIPLRDAVIGPPPITSSLYADVAQKEGFFQKVGLKMSFKYFAHGTDVAKSVLAGSQDVGFTATTAVLPLIAQGAPLKLLVGMNNVDWVVASSQPGVKTCKSLKGQKIGTDGTGNARELYLAALLKTCGLTIKDITQVSIGGSPADIAKAGIAGQVKTDVLHTSEFVQVQSLSKANWVTIPAPPTLVDQFHYLVGFATDKMIKQHRDALVRFVAAYLLARDWMMNPKNQKAFAQIASKAQGQSVALETKGLKLLSKLPYWAPGIGLDKTHLDNMNNTLVSIGTYPKSKAPTFEAMVDPYIYLDAEVLAASVK